MSFVAIDFETAANQRASACSVGVAVFEEGRVVKRWSSLIDPRIGVDEWSGIAMSIHGIRPGDVHGAPTFADLWPSISSDIESVPLVAHNSSFDIGVIRAELGRAGVRHDPFRYACSARTARLAWPELPSTSLSVIAAMLGLDLNHHEAESDAVTAGNVLVAALAAMGASSLEEMLASRGLHLGELRSDLSNRSFGFDGAGAQARATDVQVAADADPEHPLFGQRIVLTGALTYMTRAEAWNRIAAVGAIPADNVSKKVDVLVVGDLDPSTLVPGSMLSGKQRKAAELLAKGAQIDIWSEEDLLRLL